MKTTLLISLFVCHFLGDYTHLSTTWMLNAKRFGKSLFPIFCHAMVHATLMSTVLLLFIPYDIHLSLLFLFQLLTHFTIDVLKGKMNIWFPSVQNPANKQHWYIFGFDQTLHALVIILMVGYIYGY